MANPNMPSELEKQKSPDAIMNDIDAMMQSNADLSNELKAQWKRIRTRFALYNSSAYGHFSYYLRSPSHKKLIHQIWYSLHVAEQLKARNVSDLVKAKVTLALEMEMMRVEVKQLRRLGKDQELKRPQTKLLKEDVRYLSDYIQDTLRASTYSADFNNENDKEIYNYFRGYEAYSVNFKKHWRRLNALEDGLRIPRGAASFTTILVNTFAHPAVASTLSNILLAIPIVSLFIAGLGLTRDVLKAWLKDKSPATKAATTTIFVVGIIGAVISGLFPVTAAAFGCGLVFAGVVQKCILPWYHGRKAIAQKEEQVGFNNTRLQALRAGNIGKLGASEKQALMRLVEEYCLSDRCRFSIQDIATARGTIQSRDVAALNQDALVTAAIRDFAERHPNLRVSILESQTNQPVLVNITDLNTYLIHGLEEQQAILANRLEVLSAKQVDRGLLLLNSLVTLAGAILICIPTPVTMIAGISIVFASTIVSVAIENHWVQKAFGFIKGLFTRSEKEPVVAPEENSENRALLAPELTPPSAVVAPHESTKDMSHALSVTSPSPEKPSHAEEIEAVIAKQAPSASVSTPGWLGFHTNGNHIAKPEEPAKEEELRQRRSRPGPKSE